MEEAVAFVQAGDETMVPWKEEMEKVFGEGTCTEIKLA